MPTRIEIKAECAPSINLLIENCCNPLIQEIISFDTPDLPSIGAFSDSDGNCWTLVGTTEDKINSIRKVANQYGSCETCIADNSCPENFVVDSCCATFDTIFSSTLPGIAVGDSFVDNFGFCWTATVTTVAPINGIVSVNSSYPTDNCTTCLGDNECPDIYLISSCCNNICTVSIPVTLFTTLQQLGNGAQPGDIFMDQFGFCWTIDLIPYPDFTLLTGSFIQFISLISDCAHGCSPCNDDVYYTIQNCRTLQVEIIQAPFGYEINFVLELNFTTSLTPECWKIISWDNTSLPTKIVNEVFNCYKNCLLCING